MLLCLLHSHLMESSLRQHLTTKRYALGTGFWSPHRRAPVWPHTWPRLSLSPRWKATRIASDDKQYASGMQLLGFHRRALSGHSMSVTSVAFSPDGKRLASASDTKQYACGMQSPEPPSESLFFFFFFCVLLCHPILVIKIHEASHLASDMNISSEGLRESERGGDELIRRV